MDLLLQVYLTVLRPESLKNVCNEGTTVLSISFSGVLFHLGLKLGHKLRIEFYTILVVKLMLIVCKQMNGLFL